MDLPVGLTGDVDVVEVTAVVFGVSSSQKQLATGLGVRVPDKRQKDMNSNFVATDSEHQDQPLRSTFCFNQITK